MDDQRRTGEASDAGVVASRISAAAGAWEPW